MQAGKFNVVIDGQWGSCGKGKVSAALARRFRPKVITTTNMANAGHTVVREDGERFVAKALPAASILRVWEKGYWPTIMVGPTAAFHLPQFMREMAQCHDPRVIVHERAGVIAPAHQLAENGEGEGSTKHIASTMQGCGAFLAEKILRKPGLKLARDYGDLKRNILPGHHWCQYLRYSVAAGDMILHEGSQGFSLDINHGSHYPQCTSRGCTAGQAIADIGLSPRLLGDVYLVIRPFPIRVGNVVEGDRVHSSGDCYPGQRELEWPDIWQQAGFDPVDIPNMLRGEHTTVTKRLRRVFSFSLEQVVEAAHVNGATKLVINFVDYLDKNIRGLTNNEVRNYDTLRSFPRVAEFVHRLQEGTGLPVVSLGTGPLICDEIWMG